MSTPPADSTDSPTVRDEAPAEPASPKHETSRVEQVPNKSTESVDQQQPHVSSAGFIPGENDATFFPPETELPAPSGPPPIAGPAIQIPVLDPGDTDFVEPSDTLVPDFAPFFTLIEDPVRGEYHRPEVHYIFADDDPGMLTSAALDALSLAADGEADAPSGVEERILIVDLAADGRTVTGTTSLARNWQAVETSVTPAPSWGSMVTATTAAAAAAATAAPAAAPSGAKATADEQQKQGLMLRITGREAEPDSERFALSEQADVHALVRSFEQGLADLDRVLGQASTQAAATGQERDDYVGESS